MPLENAVREVAAYLLERKFVLVYAHNDADGIAAGSILCHALRREDVPFRFRLTHAMEKADMEGTPVYCDLSAEGIGEEAVVIDHHLPAFEGSYHLNPRLFGIDGERELSSSALAYLVACEMGENLDLAGLALLGMLGDRQAIEGANRSIVNEGIAQGVIEPAKGLLLAGRDDMERLFHAIDPYLPGVSGNEAICREIFDASRRGEVADVEELLSRIVLECAPQASLDALTRLYGTTYRLKRECIEDAHTMMAMLEACGKSGRGGIAATLCLRYSDAAGEAFAVMERFRRKVIDAIAGAAREENKALWIEVQDAGITGAVADAIAWDLETSKTVAVFARSEGECRISLRAPQTSELMMGEIAQGIARACGGSGGGHPRRAGARIPLERLSCFREKLAEAVA